MKVKRDPIFTDAEGMKPGDILTYDPSKEGTGTTNKEGVIKEISRSLLSLVLEDGTPIGVTRVYTHRHPGEAEQAPPPPLKKERYISFPF